MSANPAQKGVYFPLKNLLEGSGIIITDGDTGITIATTGSGPGGGDMLKSEYATNGASGVVDKAVVAEGLTSGASVPFASAAGSVPYGGITGLPTFFPTTWSFISAIPTSFPTNWSSITGIPATFPPSTHGSTHLPSGGDPVGNATSSSPGWLAQLSGHVTDYVAGNNTCQALPLVTDVGDATPPSSPTAFDDEFTTSTINPKWSLVSSGSGSVVEQLPTYLLMTIAPGGGGISSTSATEFVTTAAGFMFQFKVRLMLGASTTGGSAPITTLIMGLLVGTRSFGLQMNNINEGTYYALTLRALNGNNFAANAGPATIFPGNADWRVRIGLQGANLVIQVSPDAINWLTFYSESFTGSGTSLNGNFPTSLQMLLNNSGGGYAASTAIAAFDYVRKIS